jgi:hypothetical protein
MTWEYYEDLYGDEPEKPVTRKNPTPPSHDYSGLILLGLGLLGGYMLFSKEDEKEDKSQRPLDNLDKAVANKIEIHGNPNIPVGGRGDRLSPSDVDSVEYSKGLKVEREHTKDENIASEIALDHLAEDDHYYSHLESIHKENPIKDLKGGLTAQGRKHFKETEGANLKPGVMKVETLEDLKRWGQWARRFFGRSVLPPLKNEKGEPTRLALDAQAWGCKIPKTKKEAKVIAKRGSEALKYYKELKKQGLKKNDEVRFKICHD